MAKTVEISFAIGAALVGSFGSTFQKASKTLEDLKNQTASLQGRVNQVSAYQKLQNSIAGDEAAMKKAREQAKMLEAQVALLPQKTAALQGQYKDSQARIKDLTATLVRNQDAHKVAQLNVQSLEKQIRSSNGPTGELIEKYKQAQAEVRRLGNDVKHSRASLKAEGETARRLRSELQNAKTETKSLSQEAKGLKDNADRLQTGLGKNRETLAQLDAELKKAGIDTNNLAKEQERLASQSQRAADAQKRLQDAQARYAAAKSQLSWNNIKGELISGAAMGYSLYKPVSQAADFESAMARVNAVAFTGLGKTEKQKTIDAEEFKKLQEQARELGRATQYTAVQAANTQEVLARAGFKSNEILSAMPGLLSMAAAEGMDLAQAADIAASSLRGFKLDTKEMNRVADVLAQTSAASNTSIAGLGESMKMVAPVASSLGVSIEQVSAMLGIMANNGIKGSESGTALRNAFLRLSQEPASVEKALRKLGIASRDAQGNMRELPSIMQALSDKIKNMGEADKMKYLADIFSVRAASGMLAVMQGVTDGSLKALEQQNKEATGIFNALTEAVNKNSEKAKVTVEDFRAAMEKSEKPAKKLGISYRDLSIYMAILAQNNIKGAAADDKLTKAFTQLAKKPAEVQKALKKYNISAYTKDKTLRDFPDLLNEISNAMSKMSEPEKFKALTNIFGSKEAATAIQTLMKDFPKAFSEYDKAADGAKGVSYQMMQKNLETFKGKWDIAKSAMSDFMIEVGNQLLPEATKLVEVLGDVAAGITKIMQDYPVMTEIVVKSLGAIAAFKIIRKVLNIGKAILTLPTAWIEVHAATREAATLAGTVTTAVGGSCTNVSNLKSLILALKGPLWLVASIVALIAMNWEDVCEWCEKAGKALTDKDWVKATTPVSMGGTKQKVGTAEYHVQAMNSIYAIPSLKPEQNALGGIINRPTLSWVGEAGREAIIPLTDKSRGIPLLNQAAQELGVKFPELPKLTEFKMPSVKIPELSELKVPSFEFANLPEIKFPELPELKMTSLKFPKLSEINLPSFNFPKLPNFNLLKSETVEPEIKLPLWKAADTERNILAPVNTTNNNSENNSRTINFSPNVSISINGNGQESELNIRETVLNVLAEYKNDLERLAFV